MQLETKFFGTMEIDESQRITFQSPLYGFEEYRDFVIISDQEIGETIFWLQSVHEPQICFIVANLSLLVENYEPIVPHSIEELLQINKKEDMITLGLMVVQNEIIDAVVNLKSPIIINCTNGYASQVILDQDAPLRYPIFKKEGSE